jgi:hypothetical protein
MVVGLWVYCTVLRQDGIKNILLEIDVKKLEKD